MPHDSEYSYCGIRKRKSGTRRNVSDPPIHTTGARIDPKHTLVRLRRRTQRHGTTNERLIKIRCSRLDQKVVECEKRSCDLSWKMKLMIDKKEVGWTYGRTIAATIISSVRVYVRMSERGHLYARMIPWLCIAWTPSSSCFSNTFTWSTVRTWRDARTRCRSHSISSITMCNVSELASTWTSSRLMICRKVLQAAPGVLL